MVPGERVVGDYIALLPRPLLSLARRSRGTGIRDGGVASSDSLNTALASTPLKIPHAEGTYQVVCLRYFLMHGFCIKKKKTQKLNINGTTKTKKT